MIIRKKSEFEERLLEVKRVARVIAGGRRFSFRATIVIGNRKGKVGLGVAKGNDVATAIQKAKKEANKNLVLVKLKENRTISRDEEVKFKAAVVKIKSVKKDHGLIAGGSVRVVLELAGIKDASAKVLSRTKNKISNAQATIKALSSAKS